MGWRLCTFVLCSSFLYIFTEAQTYPPVITPSIDVTNGGTIVSPIPVTEICLRGYSESFRTNFQEIVNRVNSFIQQRHMCSDIPLPSINVYAGDVRMSAIEANIEQTFVAWLVTTNTPTMAQVESCAREVGGYIGAFQNWRYPVITPPFGCPSVTYVPEAFSNVGIDWVCASWQID